MTSTTTLKSVGLKKNLRTEAVPSQMQAYPYVQLNKKK
jgi:hypothetical protein